MAGTMSDTAISDSFKVIDNTNSKTKRWGQSFSPRIKETEKTKGDFILDIIVSLPGTWSSVI